MRQSLQTIFTNFKSSWNLNPWIHCNRIYNVEKEFIWIRNVNSISLEIPAIQTLDVIRIFFKTLFWTFHIILSVLKWKSRLFFMNTKSSLWENVRINLLMSNVTKILRLFQPNNFWWKNNRMLIQNTYRIIEKPLLILTFHN